MFWGQSLGDQLIHELTYTSVTDVCKMEAIEKSILSTDIGDRFYPYEKELFIINENIF